MSRRDPLHNCNVAQRNFPRCWPGTLAYTPPSSSVRAGTRWHAVLRPVLDKVARRPRTNEILTISAGCVTTRPCCWAEIWNTRNAFKSLRNLPHVRTPRGITIPRAAAVAEAYPARRAIQFRREGFQRISGSISETDRPEVPRTLGVDSGAWNWCLLEQIAARGKKVSGQCFARLRWRLRSQPA